MAIILCGLLSCLPRVEAGNAGQACCVEGRLLAQDADGRRSALVPTPRSAKVNVSSHPPDPELRSDSSTTPSSVRAKTASLSCANAIPEPTIRSPARAGSDWSGGLPTDHRTGRPGRGPRCHDRHGSRNHRHTRVRARLRLSDEECAVYVVALMSSGCITIRTRPQDESEPVARSRCRRSARGG